VKGVVDGDLCETFHQHNLTNQKAVASILSRTSVEILKKIEDTRNKVI
jgi:hypothetical protein